MGGALLLEHGLDPTNELHKQFNASLMVCLPKSAKKQTEQGQDLCTPSETRPITITNADNRVIASAFRLRWEPLLEPLVSRSQRGFLRGRSMIQNILDVEHSSQCAGLTCQDAVVILFDFTAAFPSVDRDFLKASLAAAGLPGRLLGA